MTLEDASALTTGKPTVQIVKKTDSSTTKGDEDVSPTESLPIKVYKRRWFMLSLYTLYGALVAAQWIQYAIIANIIQR